MGQIQAQRPNLGPPTCRCGRLGREYPSIHTATAANDTLGHMLDHLDRYRGKVIHLTFLSPGHCRAGQIAPAAATPRRPVDDPAMGIDNLRQMVSLGAGLLSLAPSSRPPLRPVQLRLLPGRIRIPRRRNRRVLRGTPELRLEIRDPTLQLSDQADQLDVGPQPVVLSIHHVPRVFMYTSSSPTRALI